MKKLINLLILGLLSLVPMGGAAAQETPELASLNIALWPEFDRPEMLVIYQGVLASETSLPAAVEIRIPARVGQPSAMAYLSEAGERLNQQYTTRVEGEALVVSFELTTRGFQLEYYDALPVSAEGEREYTLAYTADYAIADLSIEFQVPATAEGLVVEPQAGSAQTGADGLVYHLIQAGSVEAGETLSWTFRYVKDNEELTNPTTSQASEVGTQPAVSTDAGSDGNSTVLTVLVAFLAVLAVGGAAFWLGRGTRSPVAGTSTGRARPGPSSQPQEVDAAFCFKCGAALRPEADFCHKCGAPVRS